jgi:hypothetical protein
MERTYLFYVGLEWYPMKFKNDDEAIKKAESLKEVTKIVNYQRTKTIWKK